MRKISIFLIMEIFCCLYTMSQSSDHANNLIKLKEKQKITYPKIDIHAGVGIANGIRIGVRGQLLKFLSVEFSYGIDIGINTGKIVYAAGINYNYSGFLAGFIFARRTKNIGSEPSDDRYSLNVGYITPIEHKIRFFARGGIFLFVRHSYDEQFIAPNLDLGIGYVF